jgi:hypothetical protein
VRGPDTNPTRPGTGRPGDERGPAAGAGFPVPAPAEEIAAQTTRLILLGYGDSRAAADRDQLEGSVLAQVEAARVLRRYPLLNSDEPMLVTGQNPGASR